MHLRYILTIIIALSTAAYPGAAQEESATAEVADCCAVDRANPESKSSTLLPTDPSRLWCAEHNLYEDECVLCHPELMPAAATRDPARLWCNEHSIYEDECEICHPEIANATFVPDPDRLWCNEHSTYEDECLLCRPGTTAEPAADQPNDVLWCGEHGLAEIECGICHPELLANLKPGQGLKVRFESALSASKAGVRTGLPQQRTVSGTADIYARVTYNRNALVVVTPLVEGVIQNVMVDVGDFVEPGQVVAAVHSRELASVKSAYVMALAEERVARRNYDRQRQLHDEDVSTLQQLEQAQAEFDARRSESDRYRQHLLNLGLPDAEVDAVAATGSASALLSIRAPFAGTVTQREGVVGASIRPGELLFEVADLTTMWLELSVPETAINSLKLAMPVEAWFDAFPGTSFPGTLTWIAPRLEERSQMLRARAELPNPGGRLKHGMFAHVEIAPDRMSKLVIPENSVQIIDGRTVVFAKLAPDLYETRIVETGTTSGGWTSIESGLMPDAEIAVAETYVLKSELLKARLGAGCTDH